MKKKLGIFILIIIILVIAIPIAINELFKIGKGYSTLWSAADTLAYYGSVLQGIVSGLGIVITILYTRKQIRYEHVESIKREEARLIKDETLHFIEILYPLKLYRIITLYCIDEKDISNSFNELTTYQIDIKLLKNRMECKINCKDYTFIQDYYNQLSSVSNQLIDYADRVYKLCFKYSQCEIEKELFIQEIETLTKELVEYTKEDYKNILDTKEQIFAQLDENIENTLSSIIIN